MLPSLFTRRDAITALVSAVLITIDMLCRPTLPPAWLVALLYLYIGLWIGGIAGFLELRRLGKYRKSEKSQTLVIMTPILILIILQWQSAPFTAAYFAFLALLAVFPFAALPLALWYRHTQPTSANQVVAIEAPAIPTFSLTRSSVLTVFVFAITLGILAIISWHSRNLSLVMTWSNLRFFLMSMLIPLGAAGLSELQRLGKIDLYRQLLTVWGIFMVQIFVLRYTVISATIMTLAMFAAFLLALWHRQKPRPGMTLQT